MPKKSEKKTITSDFETSMAELESLVERMEQGETKLEDALQDFERGIALTRACRQSLSEAEQKVQILLQDSVDAEPEAFKDSD